MLPSSLSQNINIPKMKLVFKKELLKKCEDYKLSNVQFYGYLLADKGWPVMQRCSVGLALLHPISNYYESYPTKIFEYMAALKPIVTTDLRECKKYKSCLTAETNEEFMLQLKRATYLSNDAEYLKVLDTEANENSWEHKTIEILNMTGVKL